MTQSSVTSDTVPASGRKPKRQGRSLTLIAGYLDGYGLLVVGTYVSFMSGNTTTAGSRQDKEISLLWLLLSLRLPASRPAVSWATGHSFQAARTSVAFQRDRNSIPVRPAVRAAFRVAGVLRNPSIAALAVGMGMTNPALERIGAEAVSVTFVTGTLSRTGGHLALALN